MRQRLLDLVLEFFGVLSCCLSGVPGGFDGVVEAQRLAVEFALLVLEHLDLLRKGT